MPNFTNMEKKKNTNCENLTASHDVVERLRHLMHDKRITQRTLADYADTSPSQFSRIMNGELAISLQHIANIATALRMQIIDIFTYPDIYRDKLKETDSDSVPVEAVLQIKLRSDKRDQVLNLIFGDNNLEILNK